MSKDRIFILEKSSVKIKTGYASAGTRNKNRKGSIAFLCVYHAFAPALLRFLTVMQALSAGTSKT